MTEAYLQNFHVIHTLGATLARAHDYGLWLPHHDLFPWPPVVNSVHLPSAAVSGCMQSVSAALVIGDPMLQCICPYCSSVILAAAVLVILSVLLQCQ